MNAQIHSQSPAQTPAPIRRLHPRFGHPRFGRLMVSALAVGALAFAGCSQREQDQAKARTDQAVATVKQESKQIAADVKQAGTELKADLKDATAGARADANEAMAKAKTSVADAAITSSIKAELAKDAVLKAHDIDVDTSGGRVSLRGTAPTPEAKARARTLAAGVSGVVGVDNELTVKSSS